MDTQAPSLLHAPITDTRDLSADRAQLVDVVTALERRRAGTIPPEQIDRYLASGWLQWHAGALRLTARGQTEHAAGLRQLGIRA